MKQHDLKCWPEYFNAIVKGVKRFELRLNDRDYAVGDILNLKEWIPTENCYTGSSTRVKVTYMMKGHAEFGMHPAWVIMSISPQF